MVFFVSSILQLISSSVKKTAFKAKSMLLAELS